MYRVSADPNRGQRVPRLGVFTLLGLTAIGMSTPALLGSADFFRQFNWGYREAYWSQGISLPKVLYLVFPYLWGEPHSTNWIREGLYVGILPLGFAFWGLASWRRRPLPLFLGFFVWTLAVTYDLFNVLYLVYRHIPVFNSSMANNQIILLPFYLSIFAAFGLDETLRGLSRRRRWTGAAVAAGCLGLAAIFGRHALAAAFSAPIFDAYTKHQLKVIALAALPAVAFAATLIGFRNRRYVVGAAVAALAVFSFADLYRIGRTWNRSVPRVAFFPMRDSIRLVKDELGDGKFFSFEKEFLANMPLYYGIPNFGGRGFYTKNQLELYRLIDARAFVDGPTQYGFPADEQTLVRTQFFDALGLRVVAAPGGLMPAEYPGRPASVRRKFEKIPSSEMNLWRNREAFPRAWFVDRLVRVDAERFRDAVTRDGFDFTRQAASLDEGGEPVFSSGIVSSKPARPLGAHAESLEDTSQVFRIVAPAKGYLVVSDNYDPSWRAEVNDRPARLLRVNSNMRAVELPAAGEHVVRLHYRPGYLTPTYVAALVSLLAAIGLAVRWARRSRATT